MDTKIYQHAVLETIEVDLPLDTVLTGATFTGVLRKPDGSKLLKAVEHVVDSFDVTYDTVAGDLNQIGEYVFSVTITYAATGRSYPIDPVSFRVWPTDREAPTA